MEIPRGVCATTSFICFEDFSVVLHGGDAILTNTRCDFRTGRDITFEFLAELLQTNLENIEIQRIDESRVNGASVVETASIFRSFPFIENSIL